MKDEDYSDDYATCAATYATFRVYPDGDPAEVSRALGIEPTRIQRIGERPSDRSPPRKLDGWFLSSESRVDSRDVRRPIDWLLERLVPRAEAIRALGERWRMDVFCYWLSRSGHGGPMPSPAQMRGLASLGLTIGFDVYLRSPDEHRGESSGSSR